VFDGKFDKKMGPHSAPKVEDILLVRLTHELLGRPSMPPVDVHASPSEHVVVVGSKLSSQVPEALQVSGLLH